MTIEIRQADTGGAKNFHDKQAIADFLATRDDADKWEGHQCLGPLPEPTPQDETATLETYGQILDVDGEGNVTVGTAPPEMTAQIRPKAVAKKAKGKK